MNCSLISCAAPQVAGLGGVGDAAFQKHTAEARVHTPLAALGLPQLSLSVAATLGLLLPRRAAPLPATGDSVPPPAPLMRGVASRRASSRWREITRDCTEV